MILTEDAVDKIGQHRFYTEIELELQRFKAPNNPALGGACRILVPAPDLNAIHASPHISAFIRFCFAIVVWVRSRALDYHEAAQDL